MENTKVSPTRIMVECAILIGIATVLSIFPKFSGIWANGGSVTVCSMLPIVLAGYRHGPKWGLAAGLAFSLLQMLGGIYLPAGNFLAAVGGLLLDYILPFTLIGLAGIFRGKFKNNVAAELAVGTVFVMLLRYICHVLSGVVLWGSMLYVTSFFESVGAWGAGIMNSLSGNTLIWVYSIIYNGGFMLPELIITTVGALLVSKLALYGLPKNS